MQRGEICNLRWRDVDLDEERLTVRSHRELQTKSGNERIIPLVSDALEVMKKLDGQRQDADYVFQGVQDGQLDGHHLTKRFRLYRRMAGLSESIGFHSLRRPCGSWLAGRNVEIRIIQGILGHSDIRITQRYTKVAPEAVARAMRDVLG